MNPWRQNDILPTAVEIHNKALIDSDDLQITNIALDNIICVLLMEIVNALQRIKVINYVESRSEH